MDQNSTASSPGDFCDAVDDQNSTTTRAKDLSFFFNALFLILTVKTGPSGIDPGHPLLQSSGAGRGRRNHSTPSSYKKGDFVVKLRLG